MEAWEICCRDAQIDMRYPVRVSGSVFDETKRNYQADRSRKDLSRPIRDLGKLHLTTVQVIHRVLEDCSVRWSVFVCGDALVDQRWS